MKPNEKSYIFQQIAQKFNTHPRFWDELQTQQYLIFANLNFVAIQFQEKNLSMIRFLEEFDSSSIEIIYTTTLQFKNKPLQRMKFNKWIVITIEYMMHQEETQLQSNTYISSQSQYMNTFEDLQIIKEEKSTPMSLNTLNNAQLQLDSRQLNLLFQKILSLISQDQFNTSKHNSNIPEEREDEFDDESDDNNDEEENNEQNNIESDDDGDNNNNDKISRKSSFSSQISKKEEENKQEIEEKQEQQSQQRQQQQQIEESDSNKDQSSDINVKDGLIQEETQVLNQNYNKTQSNLIVDQNQSRQMSRSNSQPNETAQIQKNLLELELFNIIPNNQNIKIIINHSNNNECNPKLDQINSNIIEDEVLVKPSNQIKDIHKIEEEAEEISIQDNSANLIQIPTKDKLQTPDEDNGQNIGNLNENSEFQNLSGKNIKRKSGEKQQQQQQQQQHHHHHDETKRKHYSHNSRKQNRLIKTVKIDEETEEIIVDEVQNVCLVLDKQLIQWDKNELQNIAVKTQYFQELAEVIEQNDIDGFMLFIIFGDELDIHDMSHLMNISFQTALKLKSFIQILEPLRQEQMIKIARKMKKSKLAHQSSIDANFVIESPELKQRNNNIFQQSNSKYMQSLIGMSFQQVPTVCQLPQSQKPSLSTFYGTNPLKTSFQSNTYDQLQEENEESKPYVGWNIKQGQHTEKGASSQMIFEIQTREKLLSSTSDQEQNSQNFKASNDQYQYKISEEKLMSNNTIFCNESSQQWERNKNRSPNQNKLAKTALQSSNLSASQNRTQLGLSSHFTSVNFGSSYEERRNINSLPTLGSSFHFERQQNGIASQFINSDQQKQEGNQIHLQNQQINDPKEPNQNAQTIDYQTYQNTLIYLSKTNQINQNENQDNNQQQQLQSQNSQQHFSIQQNEFSQTHQNSLKNLFNEQREGYNSNQTIKQNSQFIQENILGDSSYLPQPLGMSQKVEKQMNNLHLNNKQLDENNPQQPPPLRKHSSNATLFQSENIEQQQQTNNFENNLSNSQQLSATNPDHKNQQLKSQQVYFTQSENFNTQIKFNGKDLQGQQKQQTQISQNTFNNILNPQSNPSIHSISSASLQIQNSQQQANSYQEFNQGEQQQQQQQQQQSQISNSNLNPSILHPIHNNNSRHSINLNNNNSSVNVNNINSNNNNIINNNSNPNNSIPFINHQQYSSSNQSNQQIQVNNNSSPIIYQQEQQQSSQMSIGLNCQNINQNNQFYKGYSENYVQIQNDGVQTPFNYENQDIFSQKFIVDKGQQQGNQIQQVNQSVDSSQQNNSHYSQLYKPNQIPQILQNQQDDMNNYQGQSIIPSFLDGINSNKEINNQSLDIQKQQLSPNQKIIQNDINNSDPNIIPQKQPQEEFQQQNRIIGNSYICYQNNNNNNNNSTNQQDLSSQTPQQQQQPQQNIYLNPNNMQGNSFIFQQPQQLQQQQQPIHYQQNINYNQQVQQQNTYQPYQQQYIPQQNLNNQQGHSILFQQPPTNIIAENINDQNHQTGEINARPIQGASIYVQVGNNGLLSQQNDQQINFNTAYINNNNNPQQQQQQNYHNYFNPNIQNINIGQQQQQQQQVHPQLVFDYNHHFQNNQQNQQINDNNYQQNNKNNNNNNNINHYNPAGQIYYEDNNAQNNIQPYNQNQNQEQYDNQNILLKLPNIFLINDNHHEQQILPTTTTSDNQNGQSDPNNIIYQGSENSSNNIQLQKMQKLQHKNQQILKFTYNVPFNLFKFDVIPTMKIDIKGKSSDQILKYYSFHSEGATIGRSINNSINFIDEQSISAFHAIIFYQKREFFIQDIKSKAGTFIKIKSIPITEDLKLKLGDVEIKFTKIDSGIITFQSSSTSVRKGQINMNTKQEYKLGRCKLRCDIVLQDAVNTVSYVHAQIHYNEQNQICITDLGSGNGTWLRLSERSCRSNPYKLNVNDQIMISNTKKIVIVEMEA